MADLTKDPTPPAEPAAPKGVIPLMVVGDGGKPRKPAMLAMPTSALVKLLPTDQLPA